MQTTSHTSINNNNIGPRAKCSQVVYEAIAKACEIIVRSRCGNHNEISSTTTPKNTTSTRFNIEIEEIVNVRNILQRWRRSLHVPIQLDIVLDSDVLLERWCIDYEESSLKEEQQSLHASTTIPQLRQVCKRVVILLRSLHCMTKLLPSYQLVADGYDSSKGYYNNVVKSNIKYNIHAGNHVTTDSQDLNQGNATSNYDKYQFIPIPTPYGNLRISVLYMPKVLQPQQAPQPIIETHTASPILTSTKPIITVTNDKPKEEPIEKTSSVPKERVLSGLSLALLNTEAQNNDNESSTNNTAPQCYSSDNEEEQYESSIFETTSKLKSPPTFLRMHSLDERSSNNKYFEKYKSLRSSSIKSPTSNQHLHVRGRKIDRSPVSDEQRIFSGAASASPPPYFSHHYNSSNEYGYAYNNIKTRPIVIKKTPSFTSHQNVVSASPPFSRSPALSAMPTPCLSSTPPFVSNPTCLQSSNSFTKKSFSNPSGDNLPSPLTVLQASPFESDPSSFLANSISMLAVDKSSTLTNPSSTTSFLQAHSSLLDQQLQNYTAEDNDIMPFANITDDAQNNSIYNKESMESSISTFAHKCATTAATTKLQFNEQYDAVDLQQSSMSVNDLIHQLQDFHTFSASLAGSCSSATTSK